MNRLRALSAGTRVQTRHFSGVVHSVFARACNIDTGDGRLVTLLAAEHGNAPAAIRVDAPPGFSFQRWLRVGERAGCRGSVLRAGPLVVGIADAPRWQCDVNGLRTDLHQRRPHAAWCVARQRLARRAYRAAAHCTQLPAARVGALWRAARAGDDDNAATAVASLAGCGPGLTPAGDDLLVGFLAGLHASARHPHDSAFTDALCGTVRAAARRTNPVSASYLLFAADGEFAETLAALASSVATGADDEQTRRDTDAALAVGATSGADGVRGLLLGLAAFASGETPVECLA